MEHKPYVSRIQVYSPKAEREKSLGMAVRIGDRLVKRLVVGSKDSFHALFGEYHGYTIERIEKGVMTLSKKLS